LSGVDTAKKRILANVPLERLIGETVKLVKKGGNYSGCCPFHNEKTPSFYIYPDNYHCFGCGAHGDAIKFVQEQQGLGFIDALKWLAQKFGIEAGELERNERQSGEWKKQARLSKIMAESQRFFKSNLYSPAGKDCLDYLRRRGFSDEFIDEQGFGFALNDYTALYRHLSSLGYSLRELEMCSLATKYDNGKVNDFFKNRALVPIRDNSGKLIAFGGRALDDSKNKYKNSKYDKGHTLYGLFNARKHMRQKSRAIVCEGYMDVLQLWNFGFTEAVACQGTALTANHMRLLKMSTKTVYLLFDGDNAGRNASLKAVSDALNTPELDFRVVSLPEGQDPDSFVSERGSDALEELFTKSVGLIEFALSQKLASVHQSALPNLIGTELLPWVSKINDQLKQNLLINKIADLTGFSKNRLGAQLVSIMSGNKNSVPKNVLQQPAQNTPVAVSKLQKVEVELFGHLFLSKPDQIDLEKVVEFISTQLHLSHPWDGAFETVVKCLMNGTSPSEVDVASYPSFFEDNVANLIDEIIMNQKAFAVENKQEAVDKLLLHRKKSNLQRAITDLKSELATSSIAGDESWKEIASAISSLQSQLIQLSK
jgi:DNA primase